MEQGIQTGRTRRHVAERGGFAIGEDLAAADAAPLVLTILCDGESSGYPIVRRLRERSREQLDWADGVAYPLLQRLWRLGYVRAEWRTPVEGHRRRYYTITDHGRAALAKAQPDESDAARAAERDVVRRSQRASVVLLPGRWVFPHDLQPIGAAR